MSALSEKAREYARQQNRETYYWYKSKGICPMCKVMMAAPGRVYCEACLKIKAKRAQKYGGEYNKQKCKEFRERQKAKGLCVYCARPAVEGRVLCAACARKNSEAQQVRKMRKRIARENAKEVRELGKSNHTARND